MNENSVHLLGEFIDYYNNSSIPRKDRAEKLSLKLLEVEESQRSIDARKQQYSQEFTFEEVDRNKGSFWLLRVESNPYAWLFPKFNSLAYINFDTINFLFEVRSKKQPLGHQDLMKITLIAPAEVYPCAPRLWNLQKKGELSDCQVPSLTDETEIFRQDSESITKGNDPKGNNLHDSVQKLEQELLLIREENTRLNYELNLERRKNRHVSELISKIKDTKTDGNIVSILEACSYLHILLNGVPTTTQLPTNQNIFDGNPKYNDSEDTTVNETRQTFTISQEVDKRIAEYNDGSENLFEHSCEPARLVGDGKFVKVKSFEATCWIYVEQGTETGWLFPKANGNLDIAQNNLIFEASINPILNKTKLIKPAKVRKEAAMNSTTIWYLSQLGKVETTS